MAEVVIIDAQGEARDCATQVLARHALRVEVFPSGRSFLAAARRPGPPCAVVGVMPDLTATELQTSFDRRGLHTRLIFEVDPDQVALAVELMRGGASDVLSRPMSPEGLWRCVHEVLGDTRGGVRGMALVPSNALSQRERQVAELAARGLSTHDIGAELSISYRTVEVHRRNALRKLGTTDVAELELLLEGKGRAALRAVASPTEREREVLRLSEAGRSNREIAEALAISVRTVEAHRSSALRKLFAAPADAAGLGATSPRDLVDQPAALPPPLPSTSPEVQSPA